MRIARFSLPTIRAGLAVGVATVVTVSGMPQPAQARQLSTVPARTAAAAQGSGSPDRPLPPSALPNKGLPAGQRPPVEPPGTRLYPLRRLELDDLTAEQRDYLAELGIR